MLKFERQEVFGWYNWKGITEECDTVWITQAPTANCQIFSIGGFDKLMNECGTWIPYEEEEENEEDDWYDDGGHYECNVARLKEEVHAIFKMVGKPQLLIDVYDQSQFTGPIEELFAGCVNKKTPYRNTTGRDMVMYIINLYEFFRNA